MILPLKIYLFSFYVFNNDAKIFQLSKFLSLFLNNSLILIKNYYFISKQTPTTSIKSKFFYIL